MTAQDRPLSAAEIDRYQRHIVLKEIGGAGQQKLKAARVLIIGMGGLGHPVAQYLAAAGVGTLGLVDDDLVDISNLQRQILFAEADIGEPKTQAVAQALARLNRHCQSVAHPVRATAENIDALVGAYDVIVDGSDNFATRLLVNDACFKAEKPLISGAVGRFDGQVMTFKPWLKQADGTPLPCYRSLVPDAPPDEDNCATTGIIGALTGIIGTLQAIEVIKEITGAGETLAGYMLIYDGLAGTARRVKLNWDPQNPNNGRAA
ncbi:MAG: HesA/MoeB/ThiF family protein [Alphaproteobacteria bacterium]|jgi:adenylyltransferase/sulfurtransferase|nr:HesA/MoeB/ThiF family protein [Alphaproteobacteria bacterium]